MSCRGVLIIGKVSIGTGPSTIHVIPTGIVVVVNAWGLKAILLMSICSLSYKCRTRFIRSMLYYIMTITRS